MKYIISAYNSSILLLIFSVSSTHMREGDDMRNVMRTRKEPRAFDQSKINTMTISRLLTVHQRDKGIYVRKTG